MSYYMMVTVFWYNTVPLGGVDVVLGIQASRIIQPMSLMAKQSITEGRVDSEIWGSPGSHQLLQLQ